MTPPVLTTPRLQLRMPQVADFDHLAAFYASDRSVWEGGPLDERAAWQRWAADVAQWPLRGFGPFSVQDHAGRYLGEVGIYQPRGYPEPELGWFVVPEGEGHGYASEAARAVIAWVRQRFRWPRLVNYIDAGNRRSIALALRLGGVVDPTLPGSEPGDVVIRHDLGAAP